MRKSTRYMACGLLLLAVICLLLRLYIGPGEPGEDKGEVQETEATREPMDLSGLNGQPIQVLICGNNYESRQHRLVQLTCDSPFVVSTDGGGRQEYPAGEVLTIQAAGEWFAGETVSSLRVESTDGGSPIVLPGLKRSQENPAYPGTLEIIRAGDMLEVINTLPLEQYLCGVVSSEIGAGFPLETMKAQAVCARTYALIRMYGRPEGQRYDVDDSVSFQVYNNFSWNDQAADAVRETADEVLTMEGGLVDTLYYSTSCGSTGRTDLSDEAAFAAFLQENGQGGEAEEGWYRWTVSIPREQILEQVRAGYVSEAGDVGEVRVQERRPDGQVSLLNVSGRTEDGEPYTFSVEGEYAIRKFLSARDAEILLQDGRTVEGMAMLPSAYFVLTDSGSASDAVAISGGGYGHGQGMSQNGAKAMGEQGNTYQEILEKYYPGTVLETWK